MAKSATRGGLLAGACLLICISQPVAAQVSVSIRGVIMAAPSCTINGGSSLNVPFGNNLLTTRIDGANYRRNVPYTVTCTGQTNNDMTVKLQGTGATFDSSTLRTSNSDLGVKLYMNNAVWHLNTTVNFIYPSLPRMEAVPVKRSASTLRGGPFTASATLVVVLQ